MARRTEPEGGSVPASAGGEHRVVEVEDRGPPPPVSREIVARLVSIVLGALAAGLLIIAIVGIVGGLAEITEQPFEQTMARTVFLGALPLMIGGQLWGVWRPALARAVAGGPIPVRFVGDVTKPLFAGRPGGSGGGGFGGGGGGGGCGDGGGGGC